MPESFLSVEQTARRLQLHPFTIRRQLQSGRLRGVKRGRVWRVPESALFESSPTAVAPLSAKPSTPARAPQGFGKFAHLSLSSEAVTRARREEVKTEDKRQSPSRANQATRA